MPGDEQRVTALRTIGRGFDHAGEAELRATCRRQAAMIDALARAVGDLRSGANALKAENAELRSERRRLHRHGADAVSACGSSVEEQVYLGVNAPAAARRVVAAVLAERVSSSVIERAKLTISELITNSVCHSGVRDGGLAVVRVQLTAERLRLEVEDPGRGGEIVRRPADLRSGGGFGLRVIETLSERWGSERRASGTLRVWAELSLVAAEREQDAPVPEPAHRPSAEVHVMPESRAGTWGVYLDAKHPALSEHASETAAEAAAQAHAALLHCPRIVVHDRYFRTRFTSVRAPDHAEAAS